VVSFTSRPLYLREKIPQYSLDRRLRGPRGGLALLEVLPRSSWSQPEETSERRIRNTTPAVYMPLLHRSDMEGLSLKGLTCVCAHTKPRGVHLRLRGMVVWSGRPGFYFRQWQDFFLCPTASRPDLGPTQTPVQWAPGVKRPGREANHSSPTSAEVKNGGAIPPFPRMSSGTTLPYVIMCRYFKLYLDILFCRSGSHTVRSSSNKSWELGQDIRGTVVKSCVSNFDMCRFMMLYKSFIVH
jgi:hypothetical protein